MERRWQAFDHVLEHYGATYRGTIRGDEIRGTAYFDDGRRMGTFTLRRIH